jgi:fumarate reductase flavoprotein subunit
MSKKVETDVAIVGGGPAGLAAAISAAEKGAKVTVFEKGSTTGGTGNMGMGILAVESKLQKAKQINLTREDAFKVFMDYTHWRVDARLVKAYIDQSADTIDWLMKMGVEFVEPAAYFPGANHTWHLVKPSWGGKPGPMAASSMFKAMTENARELDVKFYLNTPVKKITKDGGKITGLMAEDASGESIEAKAKAVVIGTGGFGDNPEMIKKYTNFDWGKDFFSIRVPGIAGDGIRMAWEAGAGSEGLNMEMIYSIPFGPEGPGMIPPAFLAFNQPNLTVNLLGERFLNEEIMGNTTFTGNAIARQKGRCAFAIFDSKTKKIFEEEGPDIFNTVFPVEKIENIDEGITQAIANGNKFIWAANTIDEIAAQAGIDTAGLKKTVEDYNKFCDTGRDLQLNKRARYLRPVREPKFYAAKFYPGAYGSLGGIKINYKTEVITKDFDVIPGLYAAGTDACSIYGDSYVFVLPGNTMSFAINSGRMAGANAAKYSQSK